MMQRLTDADVTGFIAYKYVCFCVCARVQKGGNSSDDYQRHNNRGEDVQLGAFRAEEDLPEIGDKPLQCRRIGRPQRK